MWPGGSGRRTVCRQQALAACALICLAGCAGSHQLHLPGSFAGGTQGGGAGRDVNRGAYVQLTLASGEELSGELDAATANTLKLVRPRSYAFEERAVAVADIVRLDIVEDAAGRPRLTPVGVALTALMVMALVAASQLSIGAMD